MITRLRPKRSATTPAKGAAIATASVEADTTRLMAAAETRNSRARRGLSIAFLSTESWAPTRYAVKKLGLKMRFLGVQAEPFRSVCPLYCVDCACLKRELLVLDA